MVTALFPVRDAALEVLQRAGEAGLTVGFEHRDVDEAVYIEGTAADLKLKAALLCGDRAVLLKVDKLHLVALGQYFVAADAKGSRGGIT